MGKSKLWSGNLMNKKNKTYVFHTDPGHGWLAVKRSELKDLGILHKVTPFSYQKGKTVYLEEDCDASLFIGAKREKGEEIAYRDSYQEHTPIRHYHCFHLTTEEHNELTQEEKDAMEAITCS
jgi:hypothetical protein